MRYIVFILFLCLSVFSVNAANLKLTIDGNPNAEIIIHPNADEIIRFAARELQKTITDISGAKLPIATAASNINIKIYLGCKFAESKFANDVKFLKGSDGFAVRSEGDNIYIFGYIPSGTRNGVYSFLEKNTDIIWARPADFGTIFSKTPTIQIKSINFRDKPVFILRGWQIASVGKSAKKSTHNWLIRNRCNWSDYDVKKAYGRGHNLYLILGKYAVDGSDFVGMRNGQRKLKGAPQPCFTNRKMWKVFSKKLLASIKTNSKYNQFNVNMMDSNRTCECQECAKALTLTNGSTLEPGDPAFRSTQFYMFLNHVAKEIKKKYPDKRLKTYAYVFTIVPPKVKLEDNIDIQYACLDRDYKGSYLSPSNKKWHKYLKDWAKISSNMRVREYYGWSTFPRPLSYTVAKDLCYLNKLGIKKIHSELNPDIDKIPWNSKTFILSEVWDASAMQWWVISNLYWNPFQDVDALRKRFITRAYRKAAPAMTKYYKILRKNWYSDAKKTNYSGHAVDLMIRYVLKKDNEKTCRDALKEAAEKAEHPNVKEMVRRTRKLFEKTIKQAKAKLPSEVNAPYAKKASSCSFDFNSSVWGKAGIIPEFKLMGTKQDCNAKTSVRVMHDKKNLYIGFDCRQSSLQAVKENKDNTKEKWVKGDHIEIFVGDGGKSYYQLNSDYRGNKYDAHGFNSRWNGKWSVKTKVTSKGWKSVIVIPFSTVKINPARKKRIRMLFYRQCHQGGKSEDSSWKGGKVHRPASFGVINLKTYK